MSKNNRKAKFVNKAKFSNMAIDIIRNLPDSFTVSDVLNEMNKKRALTSYSKRTAYNVVYRMKKMNMAVYSGEKYKLRLGEEKRFVKTDLYK